MQKILEINELFPYIILGIGLFIGIYFFYRRKSEQARMKFVYISCFVAIVIYVLYTFLQYKRGLDFLTLLPFQLCYISIISMPIILSLKKKKKVLLDFLFYTSSLGASIAIFFPAKDFINGTFSFISLTFFILHFILMSIPIWLFLWKQYLPTLSIKACIQLFFSLSIMTVVIHFFNLFLIKNGVPDANYFVTMCEASSRQNALLALFASLVPYDLLYVWIFGTLLFFAYVAVWNVSLLVYKKVKSN